jgi:hypothetical protein
MIALKSFAKTSDFQELSAKCGLDPQIMVDCFKAFASHINVPKGNGDVYHEPFQDTCIESDIVIDDCNKHAQTSECTISYKHVKIEQSHDKEDYCIHHRNEDPRISTNNTARGRDGHKTVVRQKTEKSSSVCVKKPGNLCPSSRRYRETFVRPRLFRTYKKPQIDKKNHPLSYLRRCPWLVAVCQSFLSRFVFLVHLV